MEVEEKMDVINYQLIKVKGVQNHHFDLSFTSVDESVSEVPIILLN